MVSVVIDKGGKKQNSLQLPIRMIPV